jgi:ketosteroid isomerase-like protein
MRRVLFAAIGLALLVPAPFLAQTKTAGPELALMDIERAWAAASLKSDGAALEGILAANWSAISVEGKATTRAQGIDDMKKSKFTKSEVSEMKVTMIGTTAAVVTGVWTGVGTGAKGEKVDTSERWTDVFANQAGQWKCVASQSTTIKK